MTEDSPPVPHTMSPSRMFLRLAPNSTLAARNLVACVNFPPLFTVRQSAPAGLIELDCSVRTKRSGLALACRLSPLPSLTSLYSRSISICTPSSLPSISRLPLARWRVCVPPCSCVPVERISAAANYTIRVKDAGDSGAEDYSDLFEILASTDSAVDAEESDVTGAGTVGHMNALMFVVAIVCGEHLSFVHSR